MESGLLSVVVTPYANPQQLCQVQSLQPQVVTRETEARYSYLPYRPGTPEYKIIWQLAGQYNASMNRYLLGEEPQCGLQRPSRYGGRGDLHTRRLLDSLGKFQGAKREWRNSSNSR